MKDFIPGSARCLYPRSFVPNTPRLLRPPWMFMVMMASLLERRGVKTRGWLLVLKTELYFSRAKIAFKPS
jgi:hypothetical protein